MVPNICSKIKKKLKCILTNLSEKDHNTLKEISNSGILTDGGFCAPFKDVKDLRDTIKMRTKDNDYVLIILDPQNKDNQDVLSVCEDVFNRNFTLICKQEIKEPEPAVKGKKIKNTVRILDEIKNLCEKGECIRTNSYFADKLKISVRTVSRIIKQLNENGYIVIEQVGSLRKISLYVESVIDSMDKENTVIDIQEDTGGQQDSEDISEIEPQEQELDIEKEYENLIAIPLARLS